MNSFIKFAFQFVEEMAVQYSLASFLVWGRNVNDVKPIIQDQISNKHNVKPIAHGLEPQP